jgi:ferritin-like metal-binding protein YciE
MEGLIAEADEILSASGLDSVRDAAMIGAAQRVEHYEIAGYGTARTYAEMLGHAEAAELLQQTLDEEKETDEALSGLALSTVNVDAQNDSEL